MSGKETVTAGMSVASGYAHPELLVETDWVAQHLNDSTVRLIEADESALHSNGRFFDTIDELFI